MLADRVRGGVYENVSEGRDAPDRVSNSLGLGAYAAILGYPSTLISSDQEPHHGSPPVVDNPPALRLLRLHHPRRILRTEHGGGDVDIHDGEKVLDVEVFERDGFARDASVLERGEQGGVRCIGEGLH